VVVLGNQKLLDQYGVVEDDQSLSENIIHAHRYFGSVKEERSLRSEYNGSQFFLASVPYSTIIGPMTAKRCELYSKSFLKNY
jgi:hypothetical protein